MIVTGRGVKANGLRKIYFIVDEGSQGNYVTTRTSTRHADTLLLPVIDSKEDVLHSYDPRIVLYAKNRVEVSR